MTTSKLSRAKTLTVALLIAFCANEKASAQQITSQGRLPVQIVQPSDYPTQSYPTTTLHTAQAVAAPSPSVRAGSSLISRNVQSNHPSDPRATQGPDSRGRSRWLTDESIPALRPAGPTPKSSRVNYQTNDNLVGNYQADNQPAYNHDVNQLPRLSDPISNFREEQIESARRTAESYRLESQSAWPVIADTLVGNEALANRWIDLAEKHTSLHRRVTDAKAKHDATSRDLQDVETKLKQYGLTSTIGQLLQSKKIQLSDWQIKDSHSLFISEELARSRQDQLDLEVSAELNRTGPSDVNTKTASLLAAAGYDVDDANNTSLVNRVRDLIDEQQRWIADLQRGYRDYQTKLGELDSITTKSAAIANDYRRLIDRHITWIRSDDPVSLSDLRNLKSGSAVLFDPNRSADFAPTIQRKLNANPIGAIGLLATMLAVLLIRWRSKVWLLGIGSRHRMRESTSQSRKAAASFLTVIVSFAFPAILYAISRWLGAGIVSISTFNASAAFAAAALVTLLVEICRQLIRKQSFIDRHVDVELPGAHRATNYLTLVGLGLVVAAYFVTLMGLLEHGIWKGSVARFGFMFSMVIVAWIAHLTLRPSGGFAEPLIAKFGGSVIHRIRGVIYSVAILFPIGMIVLSAIGYGFTANELTKRAIITLCAILIGGILWPGIKILCANAWHIMTGAATPKREYDEYGPIDPPVGQVTGVLAEHSLELKHHLAFLCQCALVLGAVVCIGWMWVDIFPNVQMGNPVVWNVQDMISQTSTDSEGRPYVENVIVQTPVTAFHLLLAAVTLWIAFQLATLLPAMFDALVLQRVSFDEGMEHFTLVLGRALLFGAGCLVACKLLGVRWQMIQWLAVGLMIGLGFGLQDMVRNLFGGIVVLFEKPARLGDLITVGKVTGRVATQKLRTTVLSDNDGREVIIPNKNFVSEDVVNWMGAGRLQVVIIEVAVTRDQRPADICRSLQELALQQANVLITPAPQATLICVGKRSQRIEIRVWVEEDQNAKSFQNKLLSVTSEYLKKNNWWTKNQPSQPSLSDRHAATYESSSGSQRRKRSA